MENDTKIRVASPDDARALLNIYAPYIKNTAITFEYDIPTEDEFSERIRNTLTKYPYILAECGEKIIGYAYAGTFIGRAACDRSVEVSIYIDQGFRGKGIGKMLYTILENILRTQNIVNVNACVAYTDVEDEYLNKNSVNFHTHMGYRLVGRFDKCGYKFGRWYDLVWMEKIIGEHCENPAEAIPFSSVDTDKLL
jgi:phosphinothricin acetyltransferase